MRSSVSSVLAKMQNVLSINTAMSCSTALAATTPVIAPEIDRGDLRKWFINLIPLEAIKWGSQGHVLYRAAFADDGNEVTFAHGSTVTSDVLVGADGRVGRRFVRFFLRSVPTAYRAHRLTNIPFRWRQPDIRQVDAIGGGTDGCRPGKNWRNRCYADGTLHIYVALNMPEDWINSVDFSDAKAGLAHIAEQFKGCGLRNSP